MFWVKWGLLYGIDLIFPNSIFEYSFRDYFGTATYVDYLTFSHLNPITNPTPLPLPPTYGWLSYSPIEWQPPKAGALPISHFFDGCHFGAPIKGISCSKREPGRPAPAVDS